MVKRMFILFTLLCAGVSVQAQSCFATVELDRRSVYVQQPFKVTITVLTSTWFTAPVEFDNLQVPNAFVLPFDRNYPGMFNHNGTQYPGIQFHFIVFPYTAGHFTLPSIVVRATTPPEGSSESKLVSIKTPAAKYTVKLVPANAKDGWFVARSASIHERWNKPLSDLRVGDVIERTVTVDARGTLPQFIPAIHEHALDFANVYPQDPELKDLRDENDARGELTQTFIYLLEKEGKFVIPEMPLRWWNPNLGKMSKRLLPAHTIVVKNNPHLGMIASIRDSLNATQRTNVAATGKSTFTILGLKWYTFLCYTLMILMSVTVLARMARKVFAHVRAQVSRYRKSETYWFRQLLHSPPEKLWGHLYEWWDRVEYDRKDKGIVRAFQQSGNTEGADDLRNANGEIYHNGKKRLDTDRTFKSRLVQLRQWLRQNRAQRIVGVDERQKDWPG